MTANWIFEHHILLSCFEFQTSGNKSDTILGTTACIKHGQSHAAKTLEYLVSIYAQIYLKSTPYSNVNNQRLIVNSWYHFKFLFFLQFYTVIINVKSCRHPHCFRKFHLTFYVWELLGYFSFTANFHSTFDVKVNIKHLLLCHFRVFLWLMECISPFSGLSFVQLSSKIWMVTRDNKWK